MIHAKLLIRRLAYVPWLLAAGLVLGWAGEAAAQQVINLTVSPTSIREDAGETTVTVKAKVSDDTAVTANTVVALSLANDAGRAALNKRFRMNLSSITIPKGKKEATATYTFIPDNDKLRGDDAKNDFVDLFGTPTTPSEGSPQISGNPDGKDDDLKIDDLVITIDGSAGATNVTSAKITLLDDDKLSTDLDLSFSPGELSNEASLTNVAVTATLNGSLSGIDHDLTLAFRNAASIDTVEFDNFLDDASNTHGLVSRDTLILTRDSDYSATAATLKLRKKHASGKATITIDPKETKAHDAYIALEAVGLTNDNLKGIDLNLNGDTGSTFTLYPVIVIEGHNATAKDSIGWGLQEEALGCKTDNLVFNLVNDSADSNVCNDILTGSLLGIPHIFDSSDSALVGKRTATSVHAYGATFGTVVADSVAKYLALARNTEEIAVKDRLKLKEADLLFPIDVNAGFFKIKNAPLLTTKEGEDGLVATPKTIREEDGRTEIAMKVVLVNAVSGTPANVRFTIEEENEGDRDVKYVVTVDDLTIPVGEKEGTATLTLTPTNNSTANGNLTFTVKARVGATDTDAGVEIITIVDDESLTENITLAVSPSELKAGTGATDVTVTGSLDGKTFDEDVKVTLIVTTDTDDDGDTDDDDKAAQRDTDYTAALRALTIPAGAVSGETTVEITALAGGDKIIGLKALKSPVKNDDDEDVVVSTAKITLKDADPAAETPDPGALAFSVDVSSTVFEGTVGAAIDPIELPEAEGGTAPRSYSVSASLPAGLSFDAATQTISGTPVAAGTATIVYTVIDSDGDSAAMKVTIEVSPAPAPTVTVKSVTSTHSSVRENGEMTAIAVTATLASASATDETVRFTIVAPSAGATAIRDVDYTAALGGVVTIAAGDLQGTTMLSLTPINNAVVDGNKYLGVQASASGGAAQTDIKIADDETPSTSLSLSVTPHTVSEDGQVTNLTVTATLDGRVLDSATTVTISVDPNSAATRDVDYSALFNPLLVIPAGSTSGSIALLIDPTSDSEDEGNETITLNGTTAGLTGGSADITLSDSAAPPALPEPEAMPLAFAEGMMIADIGVTAGSEMDSVVLPEASGGSGDISYSVSELPDGVSFDPATRTISGTPTTADTTEVTYTATDSGGATASLTFSITVNAMLEFGDFGSLFGSFNGALARPIPRLRMRRTSSPSSLVRPLT